MQCFPFLTEVSVHGLAGWKFYNLIPSLVHLLHSEVLIYPKQGRLQALRPAAYVCVRPWECVCVFSHRLRHSCCESAPLFLSWVTHPVVAWLLQSGESFLLRLCLRGRMGFDIYSGSGVSVQIMYVFVCMRASAVAASANGQRLTNQFQHILLLRDTEWMSGYRNWTLNKLTLPRNCI